MRNYPVLTIRVTMPCTIRAAAQRQWWSKIAAEKFVNQCLQFEHEAVIDRQPMESLLDGCDMSILSMISDNTCILNTLQVKTFITYRQITATPNDSAMQTYACPL